jgi:DNA repair exonuclease SbcCD ATPase subunit
VTYAREQQNVETLFSTLSDSLFALSSQIPQFSNKINEKKLEVEKRLSRSLTQLTERDQRQSSVSTRQTLGGINEIAFMLANLLEQLQNSDGEGQGGGSGQSSQQIMEQLQQSGQQQQQLNQQIQDLINDIQGDRLTQEQMERLNQLAEQQNMIRKQLQQLQQSGELDGDRLGSELQRMIEEMEDTINDLRGGSTDAIMIERQQNILSRMLEAEKAIQERDEEDKREGQRPEDTEQVSPPELTIEELEKQIRNRLNDPNFTKFSPDYQRLIQNYFELLKELQEREIQ